MKVSFVVNSVFTSRTYVLFNDDILDVWVVDCGDVVPLVDAISFLKGKLFTIKGVLLTHAHYDHIYGLPRLTELFPKIKVYTNDFGKAMLANPRTNMSKYHDDPIVYDDPRNVVVCKEEDMISLFDGVSARVYETPGHNPSCLTFEVGDSLFTGDAFIPGVKVVTNLPGGNKELAAQSLVRIMRLAEGKILFPGHVVEEQI